MRIYRRGQKISVRPRTLLSGSGRQHPAQNPQFDGRSGDLRLLPRRNPGRPPVKNLPSSCLSAQRGNRPGSSRWQVDALPDLYAAPRRSGADPAPDTLGAQRRESDAIRFGAAGEGLLLSEANPGSCGRAPANIGPDRQLRSPSITGRKSSCAYLSCVERWELCPATGSPPVSSLIAAAARYRNS